MFERIVLGIWYVVIGIGFVLDQFIMPICFDEWNTVYFGLAFFGGWLAYVALALLGIGLERLRTRRL